MIYIYVVFVLLVVVVVFIVFWWFFYFPPLALPPTPPKPLQAQPDMQNSALSKQSAAVNTICLILTIKVDGELGKVKGIKSYLQ